MVKIYAGVSDATVDDCITTLRCLRARFASGAHIDKFDMEQVERALNRVDIDSSFARQADRVEQAPAFQQAAE